MKFIIDTPIETSYEHEITYERTNDFSWALQERQQELKLAWIEPDERVVKGWIDDDGICHVICKEIVECVDIQTIEELYAITKANQGRIVFATNIDHEGIDGWIEIYDDYRE